MKTQERLQKELDGFKSGLVLKFQYLDHMTIAFKGQPEMIKRYVDGMKHDRQLIDEWTAKLDALQAVPAYIERERVGNSQAPAR